MTTLSKIDKYNLSTEVNHFMFGDYDFLTDMYGLSGAAGKQCRSSISHIVHV